MSASQTESSISDIVNVAVDEPLDAAEPRVKQAPTRKGLGTPFVYNPSADGTDENLLILLHGLGASCKLRGRRSSV